MSEPSSEGRGSWWACTVRPFTVRGRRLAYALVAALVVAGCDGGPTVPDAPRDGGQTSQDTPPQTVPDFTGTVFEYGVGSAGERRPVPNLRLKVQSRDTSGRVELPDVVTDRNGRYAVSGVTTVTLWFKTAPGSEYKFLCDAIPVIADRFRPPVVPGFPLNIGDLPVVSANWSGDRLPPGMPVKGSSVYGRVSERLGDMLQPVTGATVSIDNETRLDPATTDAKGFYMICADGGADFTVSITARKAGYGTVSRQFVTGWDYVVDFELVRQRAGAR